MHLLSHQLVSYDDWYSLIYAYYLSFCGN
jgi:hypothetical protein